ncbi:HDOD domain-containing protein [Paludibacterium purpuratum]|uniref:HDOD domain-containing protein n=1 Tax=Paludibacterium purpuratum TaxID=1144873 RepID=A0A4R7B241_9NEIS|nr:HDOD domain-containing protein [Paludibacterium purpuratum]TDR73818.1 HDOD domain-containing protein [Paludibacterium purpuratum]
MELNSWLNAIAARRWPILPGTMAELRQACARHSDLINFTDLANLSLSDPLLLFDLIRVVGGSRALQRNESMPSIEQAMMLIGLEPVVSRFNSLTVLEPLAGRLHPGVVEDIAMWLAHGRVAAIIAKDWLSLAGEHKVEDCYIAALVYNLPACFYLLYSNRTADRPLLQEVAEVFGLDYPKLLEQFVKTIPLPMGLLNILSTDGGVSRRKQLLRLAVGTANGLVQGAWRPQWWVGIEAAARLIGVSPAVAYSAIPHACLQVARTPRAMSYSYPLREFIMLPGAFHQAEMHAIPPRDDEGELDVALRDTVRHLAQDLHFRRVLFLRYDSEGHCLKLRYQVGLPPEHPLRNHAVGTAPGTFFALMSSKPQSFHAPPAARAKIAESYPDEFFSLLDGDAFAAMAIFTGHQLVGVFYVDYADEPRELDAEIYQRFKELVVSLTGAHT